MNKENSHITRIEIYAVALICGLISMLIGFSMNQYLPVNIQLATVDMTGIIHRFVKMESMQSLSADQHQAHVHDFSTQLETTLKEVAKEKHVILMPKEAVIAGGLDLTAEVSQRLGQSDVK